MRIDVSRLEKTMRKLKKKDPALFEFLKKKIKQLSSCSEIEILHFKNLRAGLSSFKRVQVGSFVLKFKLKGDTIVFYDFVHHDKAYRK